MPVTEAKREIVLGRQRQPARRRRRGFFAGMALGAFLTIASTGPASAELYAYRVLHPIYGDIGTYSNTIDRRGDNTEVQSELHIAVKLLGIVVYRQEARRVERWVRDRLVSFEGETTTNGKTVDLRGEARDDGFAVTTASGTQLAPADVHPSNPWCAMVLKSGMMMSTRSGRLIPVTVSGGERKAVTLDGTTRQLYEYDVIGDKHDVVWLDDHGVPLAFRTVQDGSAVDFVLAPRPATTRAARASGSR
jgi:hypothetical protein